MTDQPPVIRPFSGLRPAPGRSGEVIAPPYDVVSTEEARARAAGRPWSFLHVSRPEIDLPEGVDPHDRAVYRKGADTFHAMRSQGVLVQDPTPCYYVYRLTMGTHAQTGLVATAAVSAYDAGRVRRHELTRPDKEDDRVRHIESLEAQTGPAFLTYRRIPAVDELMDELTASPPQVDVVADDGVHHALWLVPSVGQQELLGRAFQGAPRLYIADGHHRSAAASRVAASRRVLRGGRGESPSDYFLAVLFPDHQVRILAYHRVVRDLAGMDERAFLARVADSFEVTPVDSQVSPRRVGEMGLFLRSGWYRLHVHPDLIPLDDPVGQLDVSLLSDHLLGPLLDIRDLRRDRRIDFVGGIRGLPELERRVQSGEMSAAFALYPTRLEDLMTVADAGLMMPPKSTWFEPKLADGLVSHLIG
jgi:uncharacterized protein (DUF1015 family)